MRLNRQGPFWLMLDTGSPGMVLDTATAKRLGLPLGTTGEAIGAGEGSFAITEVETPVDAELPGLRLVDQPAAAGPLDQVLGPFEGRRIEGILGCHNLMTRFVVEIDYGLRRIHFLRPEDFEPGAGARTAPITLEDGHFLVAGVEDRSEIRVTDVVPGSPADEAGIEIGDRLVGMEGEPLGEVALERVRRTLRGQAGAAVELSFERDGKIFRVALPLRRVV